MLNTCSAQSQFIKQSIAHNIRIDGRNSQTRRTPIIKTDVIAHLPGSSYVYLEYQNVQIYTGIKIKVEQSKASNKSNLIALELSSMRKLREQENDEMQRMQHILQRQMIAKLASSQQITEFLQIAGSKKHKLTMYIDVFLLSSPHISQLQLIIIGIKSALCSSSISQIQVSYNEVTDEQTTELTKNMKTFKKAAWEQTYIIGLVNFINNQYFLVDMKKEQYESVDACFLVTVLQDKVIHLQSLKGVTSIDTINRCARFVVSILSNKINL